MFIGVCAAALLVIPALCSVAIKPIMHKIGLKTPEDHKNNEPNNLQMPVESNQTTMLKTPASFNKIIYPKMNTFTSRPQVGLRVGGL